MNPAINPQTRSWFGVVVLSILMIGLPFEFAEPVASIAGHNIRSVHAIAMAAVIALAAVAQKPRNWPSAQIIGGTVLCVLLVISAITADGYRLQAGVSARRLITGLLLAALIGLVLQTRDQLRFVLGAFVLGANVAGVSGLVHLSGWFEVPLFDRLWGQTTMFGTIERLSLPFGHANVAGGQFAIATLLAMGLAVEAANRQKRALAATFGLSAVFLLICLSRTYSRSAGLALVLALVVALVVGSRSWRAPSLAGLALLGLVFVADPTWALRVENPEASYFFGVHLEVPSDIGAWETQAVIVTNESSIAWEEDQALVRSDFNAVGTLIGEQKYELPDLDPGDSVEVELGASAPRPEAAVLVWDISRSGQPSFSKLSRKEPAKTVIAPTDVAIPEALRDPVPPRLELWRTSLNIAKSHPLLGVGPGNFRLHYSAVLGIQGPQTTHAHSIIFEPLASWGVPALLAFAVVTGLTFVEGFRHRESPVVFGCLLALGAAVFIGGADWLLASAAGGLSFWMLIGLINTDLANGPPQQQGLEA